MSEKVLIKIIGETSRGMSWGCLNWAEKEAKKK